MNKNDKWFAVVNPCSANGKTKNKWPFYYKEILKAGLKVDYAYTSSRGNGIELTRQAISEGYKRIIAVGGDGTVNEVLNGLLTDDKTEEGVELAILSQGTGSDFVRTCQSRNSVDSFIKSLQEYSTVKSDVGKVTYHNDEGREESRYFLNASNLGIGADIVQRVNNRTKFFGSKLTYFSGSVETILKYSNISTVLKFENNQETENTFCGLVICNGRYIGGGMQIAPEAEIDDGLFDLIVIRDMPKIKRLFNFPLIYQGKHVDLPVIAVYRCSEICLQSDESALVEADGEIIGYDPINYRIISRCLTLRV